MDIIWKEYGLDEELTCLRWGRDMGQSWISDSIHQPTLISIQGISSPCSGYRCVWLDSRTGLHGYDFSLVCGDWCRSI